jgi:CBS domain-containing protein
MKARDVMTPNPTTRRPEDDLRNVLEVMRKEDVGIVPITEGNGDQKIAGVVTDRDIAIYLGERDRKPSDVRVSDVMTKDVVSVAPDADIQEVSRKMQEAQVRRVLVTEGKRLTGVIATADLARASAHSNRDEVGEEVEKVMEKVSAETGSHRPRA